MLINEEETDLTTEMDGQKQSQFEEGQKKTSNTNRYWNNRYTPLDYQTAVQN